MPDWYSELGSFAGFRLITSLHTLLTDDKLSHTLEILNRCCAKRCFVESTSHSDFNVLREFSILLIWDADERRAKRVTQPN